MDYPIINISNSKVSFEGNNCKSKNLKELQVDYKKNLEQDLFLCENSDYFIFSHSNYEFKELLKKECPSTDFEKITKENIQKLHWGFILIYDKPNNSFTIFNDIFGIYPLYYCENSASFILSNDFDHLAKIQDSLTINECGIYDYVLFNYTLKSRTLFNEISQIEGGSEISYKDGRFNVEIAIDIEAFIDASKQETSINTMCNNLITNVQKNIDPKYPNTVPLTGGFDSKVIISILLNLDYNFDTFTFGLENSPDCIAASSTARQLNFPHRYFGMSSNFLDDIQMKLKQYIRNHPNAPMFDSLLYYLSIKEILPASNFITGQMGGELIVGPVLISELITTRSFAMLSTVSDKDSLYTGLIKYVNQIEFLNIELFSKKMEEYVNPLQDYIPKLNIKNNLNIVQFLLKETYAKFFGTVFSNLFGKFNIINPLIDIEYLRNLLNSKYRFTNKKPFKKAPLSHFNSRRLYPKLIKKLHPRVLKTNMDRGYDLEDFLHWYNFPKPFLNYLKRHLFKKQIVNKMGQINYLEEIKKLTIELLPTSRVLELNLFNKEELCKQILKMKSDNISKLQEKKLIQLLTLHYLFERYSKNIKM